MTDPARPRVLLVGHCMPDAYMIKSIVERAAPAAEIVRINTSAALDAALGHGAAGVGAPGVNAAPHENVGSALLLVNRVLDGHFTASDGIELIRDILMHPTVTARAILISNLDDAQREAQAAGALPGFGKDALYSAQTRDRLTSAIQLSTQA